MSKIIAVINSMISNSNKISQIIPRQKEYYFLYDNKYKWSISVDNNDVFYLHYYAGEESIEQLASYSALEWSEYQYVTYSSKQMKTREAYESMQELYRIVKEKLCGVDEAFDDIIKGDETI